MPVATVAEFHVTASALICSRTVDHASSSYNYEACLIRMTVNDHPELELLLQRLVPECGMQT